MGVSLFRTDFNDWLVESIPRPKRQAYVKNLENILERPLQFPQWLEDDVHEGVGGYDQYGAFLDCLLFLTEGYTENDLEPDDELSLEILESFKGDGLKPNSIQVQYAAHFLEVGDTSAIYMPMLFDDPIEIGGTFFASRLAAQEALEEFADGFGFDLTIGHQPETVDDRWIAAETARNVARVLYRFFKETPDLAIVHLG